ncbi:hypothetical protein PoB_006552600 [Plakobranchus ocellatus]|uniref:Uncharacterized protein n=1 Tax=Plakobranchus ocellatus TaxID=259542 RepID=A0AAV4D4J5_9GAST|nr:hypothetical protein PoB_006552600 [Plakobranchus ocellatus]
MFRRNQQPIDIEDTSSENSDENEDDQEKNKLDSQSAGDKAENTQRPALADGEQDSNRESYEHEDTADTKKLLFPFLKDHGLESMSICRYFKLTLGASMSREGHESHTKTIQVIVATLSTKREISCEI